MLHRPSYDPTKTFQENYDNGPWGEYTDGKVYKNTGEPQYDFLGHKVYLPFGIASGPLFNSKYVTAALDKGFDIVIQKTVRSHIREANPYPNIVPLDIVGKLSLEQAKEGIHTAPTYNEPLTITNSFGNPSFSPDVWQPDLKKSLFHVKKGQVLICAIEGNAYGSDVPNAFVNDWVTTAKLVLETGVPIIEANASCPNEGSSNLLCFDIKRTTQIMGVIKNAIGNTSLIIKLAYFSEYEQLKELVKEIGGIVDVISCINTIPTKVIDEKGDLALPGRPVVGGCGAGVKWAGLDMVKNLKKLREEFQMKYTIIGMGGVFTPEDYQEYRNTGADVVMSATGAIWNPYLAQEIKEKYL